MEMDKTLLEIENPDDGEFALSFLIPETNEYWKS